MPIAVATKDGGSIWATQSLPKGYYAARVSCPTATDCVAVGNTYTARFLISGDISTTNDGGDTWTAGELLGMSLDDITCATDDGGQTWVSEPAPAGVGILSMVSCPSATKCWSFGATSHGIAIISTAP